VDFRRIHSQKRRKDRIDHEMYDESWVQQINIGKQTIKGGHYDLV
jgi:hypothetical protein